MKARHLLYYRQRNITDSISYVYALLLIRFMLHSLIILAMCLRHAFSTDSELILRYLSLNDSFVFDYLFAYAQRLLSMFNDK